MSDDPVRHAPVAPIAAISDASTIPYRVGLLETSVIRNSSRIDSLEDWRAELRGAYSLVRFTLGASIVSSILAAMSIAALLSGQVR